MIFRVKDIKTGAFGIDVVFVIGISLVGCNYPALLIMNKLIWKLTYFFAAYKKFNSGVKTMHNIFLLIFLYLSISVHLYALKIDSNSAIILGNKVNVREKPSLKANKIIQLNKGDYVVIKGSTPKMFAFDKNRMIEYYANAENEYGKFFPWYKIEINNKIGWVFGKYIGINIASNFYNLESEFRKFSNKEYKFISSKENDILWFVSCYHGEEAADTQNEIFKIIISDKTGHYFVDDLQYNDLGDKIKEIKVIRNNLSDSSYLLIDSYWQCETDPCNGQRIDILGFNSKLKIVKKIFSSITFENNSHSDGNAISFIEIKNNTISENITNFKREWNDEKQTYFTESNIFQIKIDYVFNASKFEFEKKNESKISIKGITKSNTILYNVPVNGVQLKVIPLNNNIIVQKIKNPVVTAEEFNNEYGYWIYVTSGNMKGWTFSNTIKFEENYLSYYFNCDSSDTFERIKNVKLFSIK